MNETLTQDKDLVAVSVVYDYLQDHPEFFQLYPELLNGLRLPHQQRGSVSLVERQLELQREKMQALEDDITRLMSVARQNEHIFLALNQLHISLYQATTLQDVEQSLQRFAEAMPSVHCCNLIPFADNGDSVDPFRLLLSRRLQSHAVYLGRLNKEEQQGVLPEKIRSAALILIQQQHKPLALLAFGSESDDHFQPAMDKLFINHLADLLSLILPRYVTA
ncbi:DUF484 family protein [Chromatiaceae bacterium AAb-1]|nr:DUF484 family protein [Chromatiaceae bacterium AAb-1]